MTQRETKSFRGRAFSDGPEFTRLKDYPIRNLILQQLEAGVTKIDVIKIDCDGARIV